MEFRKVSEFLFFYTSIQNYLKNINHLYFKNLVDQISCKQTLVSLVKTR